MQKKLLKAIGIVGAMTVALGGSSAAAWSPFGTRHSDADAITVNEAMPHVNQWTNAQGTVSEVLTNRGAATIVDVGGHYPNLAFKAVLFPDAAAGKTRAERRLVIISGTIKFSHGQPEITVTSRNQIAL